MTDTADPSPNPRDQAGGSVSGIEVRRADAGDVETHSSPKVPLADGQIRLRVLRYAVTANNVSYAGAGDLLGYWDFYPAPNDPTIWGRVPAMGFAEVVESRQPDLAVGGRYYGWFPMCDEVVMTVAATRDGFRDDGDHRQAHAPIYRAFVAADRDPYLVEGADSSDDELDRHAVLRVLFLTGFLADEFFADGGGDPDAGHYFGAKRVLVLSASSKTAIGFAQRAAQRDGVEVVGLTSATNVDFVTSLGWYDEVITYDEIESLAVVDSVVIDMAGNAAVLGEVHALLGDHLKYSMMIGRSHHDAPPATAQPAGPPPQFFFAPADVERRVATWGADEYRERTIAGMREFIDASRDWLRIERRDGIAGGLGAWSDVYDGAVPPDVGVVVVLGSP